MLVLANVDSSCFVNIIININVLFFSSFYKIIVCGEFWTAIGSIGTLISVIVAVVSIKNSNKRTKSQATLEYFSNFKKTYFDIENKIHEYDTAVIVKILNAQKKNSKNDYEKYQKEWRDITEYLSSVERLATGALMGVLDIEIINRMCGHYLYKQYVKLYPIIEYKRKKDNNPAIYEEFKNMVNEIVKIRRKKGQESLRKIK